VDVDVLGIAPEQAFERHVVNHRRAPPTPFRIRLHRREGILDLLIRATLARLGVRWERAKRWIESPDPEYARKRGIEIGWYGLPGANLSGFWASRMRGGFSEAGDPVRLLQKESRKDEPDPKALFSC
jgi:hypothetical protein